MQKASDIKVLQQLSCLLKNSAQDSFLVSFVEVCGDLWDTFIFSEGAGKRLTNYDFRDLP